MSTEFSVNESTPRLDYNSPDWHRIVEFLNEEREGLIASVLARDVAERNADFYRGRILQIGQILDWSPHTGR